MVREKRPKTVEKGDLTALELEVMQTIWDRGTATAAEVGEALERDLAPTTIHTVLAHLREKGAIEPIPTIERALRFAPILQREEIGNSRLKRLLKEFFGGSPKRLMAHLLSEDGVDEKELEEIRALLEDSEGKEGKSDE
jgi:predicted transcriptional regulator